MTLIQQRSHNLGRFDKTGRTLNLVLDGKQMNSKLVIISNAQKLRVISYKRVSYNCNRVCMFHSVHQCQEVESLGGVRGFAKDGLSVVHPALKK
jgi:hypothetical protein